MSAAFRVDLSGQSVQFRFQNVSFDGIRAIVSADVSQDINARAAKAANLNDLADKEAANRNLGTFATRALAVAATISTALTTIVLRGYSAAGDLGAARYKRAVSEPSHNGKFQSADGAWWELAEKIVRPEMFGAVGDGSTNDATAWQSALSFAPVEIVADQTYKINSAVTGSSSVRLTGKGTIDCSAGGSITISGSLTQVSDLSGNVSRGDKTLSFSSVSGISEFDDLFIYNPTDYSWSNARANYRAGEVVSVATISGTTVTIVGMTVDSYTAADVDVYRLNPVTVHVSDLKFIEATSGYVAPLRIEFGADCELVNVKSRSSYYGGIVLDRCVRSTITGGNVKNNSVAKGYDYGVIISNCHEFTVLGGSHSATRHALTLGGTSNVCCIPNRHGKIVGLTLRSSVSNAAADIHGNSEFIEYINCDIFDSAAIGGANVSLRGCNIYQRDTADGCCVVLTEVNGGQILIDGCTLYTDGDGNAYGYIDWNANTLPKYNTTLVVRNLIVRGLTSESSGGGASARVVLVNQRTAYSTMKIDIDVRGVRCDFAELHSFVYASNADVGTFYSDGIISDDLYGPAYTYIIYPHASMAAVPTREMTQKGRAYATTTASSSLTSAAQTYRLRYSRVPFCSAPGVALDGGGAAGLIAGKLPVPRVTQITAQQITPSMYSADGTNFTAGVYVQFDWEVGVRQI